MKKFFKEAIAGTAPGGFVVRLDGKVLKTPLRHALLLPSMAAAEAVAAEWRAQGDEIVPATMPQMQLFSTMIDKVAGDARAEMMRETMKYAESDLVCYFAAHPADLALRHEKHWRPLLKRLAGEGIALQSVSGIQYIVQDERALRAFQSVVAVLDHAAFTALQAVTAATGSIVIAYALVAGWIDATEAYTAALIDEEYQIEKWGEDKLARDRMSRIRLDIEAAAKFLTLVKSTS